MWTKMGMRSEWKAKCLNPRNEINVNSLYDENADDVDDGMAMTTIKSKGDWRIGEALLGDC